MKQTTLCSIIALTLVVLLTACQGAAGTQGAGQGGQAPGSGTSIRSDSTAAGEERAFEQDQLEAVTLTICAGTTGDFNRTITEEDSIDEILSSLTKEFEHRLSGEEADFIRGLFYRHEQEACPWADEVLGGIVWEIGGDCLKFNRFDELVGTIQGKDVLIALDDAESRQLFTFLKAYADEMQDFPEQYPEKDTSFNPEDAAVTLKIYSEDGEIEKTLSSEEEAFVRSLFYQHENRIWGSPIDSMHEFAFWIGEDQLGASASLMDELDGVVNGRTVSLSLNEAEVNRLHEILKPYAAFFYSFPELADIEASIAARELDAGFRSGEITAWYQEDGSWRACELREQAAKRVETLCTIEEIKWDSGELELPVYLLDFHNGTVVGVYRENHRGFLCKIEDRARFEAALKDGEVKPNMPGLTEAKGCIIYELYDGLVDLTK